MKDIRIDFRIVRKEEMRMIIGMGGKENGDEKRVRIVGRKKGMVENNIEKKIEMERIDDDLIIESKIEIDKEIKKIRMKDIGNRFDDRISEDEEKIDRKRMKIIIKDIED